MNLKNCWEIKKCGRERGGGKVGQLGTCVASQRGLGHSCWAIAGTLCGGAVQGTVAQKEKNCMACDVYKLYNRTIGRHKDAIAGSFPAEHAKYRSLMTERMGRLNATGAARRAP